MAADAVGRRHPHGRPGGRAPAVHAPVPAPGQGAGPRGAGAPRPARPGCRRLRGRGPVAAGRLPPPPPPDVGLGALPQPLGEHRDARRRAGARDAAEVGQRSVRGRHRSGLRHRHRRQRAELRGDQRDHLGGVLRRDDPPARLPAEDPGQRGPAGSAARLGQRHGLHRHRPRGSHHLVQPGRGAAARVLRPRHRRTHHPDAVPREPRDPVAGATAPHHPGLRRRHAPRGPGRRPGHPRLDLRPQGRQSPHRVGQRHGRARRRRPPGELPQRRARRDRSPCRRAGPGLRPGQGAGDQPADARPRPGEGRVRLGGQPRAAHPADQHRRLHRAARRRHRRTHRASSNSSWSGSTATATGCSPSSRTS